RAFHTIAARGRRAAAHPATGSRARPNVRRHRVRASRARGRCHDGVDGNRALAARSGAIVPLIAETGGLNTMIVDSTALPEQVIDDVVSSAFMSAGQRCSALRLLFLQEDIADTMLEMLAGAMDELVIGDPADLRTDVGPVIRAPAAEGLMRHVAKMRDEARIIKPCRLAHPPSRR